MPNFKEEARIVRELTRAGNGPDPFSSAVRATRMPMIITDPRRPDNPIVFVNAAFSVLTGYDREHIIGRNCRFLQGPATDRAEVQRLRDAIDARRTIELELLNYKVDGSTFWNRLLVSPVFDEDGELTYFFASQLDVTLERERLTRLLRDRDALESEVAHRTTELKAAEQRLRFALEAGRLGTWSIDLESERLIASDGCKAICGRAPHDSLTLDELRSSIHPADRPFQRQALDHAVATGALLDVEYRITTPSGEERWVQIRGQASYRADGTPIAIAGTTQDVTERRQLQDQRALVATELNHRVKNTLAALQAVAAQTIRQASSLDEAGSTLQARIRAMAAANDLLVTENFESIPMRVLLERTLAPFGVEDPARFTLDGPDLRLPTHLVTAYALGVHELATNAAKYGALSNVAGRVCLKWQVIRHGDAARLHLSWTEKGGPPVVAPANIGFGTRLLQRVLATQAGGSIDMDYRREGIVFTAVSPLSDPPADSV